MGEHYRQVGCLPFHEEDLIRVGAHVALLQQGCPEHGPLRPLGDLLLGVVLIISVGVGIEIFQTYREQDIITVYKTVEKLQNYPISKYKRM